MCQYPEDQDMKTSPLSQQATTKLISRHETLRRKKASHLSHGESDVLENLEAELRNRTNDDAAVQYIKSLDEAMTPA